MRGKPVIQWMIFLIVWVSLALPIVRMTRGERRLPYAQTEEPSNVMTWVSLRFSEEPSHFELLQGEHPLWRPGTVEGMLFEEAFPVSIDEYGADLMLKSHLPGPGVIEITVEPDERRVRSRTLWVNGEVEEILTFSWSRDD